MAGDTSRFSPSFLYVAVVWIAMIFFRDFLAVSPKVTSKQEAAVKSRDTPPEGSVPSPEKLMDGLDTPSEFDFDDEIVVNNPARGSSQQKPLPRLDEEFGEFDDADYIDQRHSAGPSGQIPNSHVEKSAADPNVPTIPAADLPRVLVQFCTS